MRIATFNCENLFSLAKVLNLRNNDEISGLLKIIGELQDELQKDVYVKAKIMLLYKKVKEYITIRENRGKLFKRNGLAITGIKAAGRNEWDREIVFKRERFNEMTRVATAKVIREMKPDILCLIEVEDRLTLENFYDDILKSAAL